MRNILLRHIFGKNFWEDFFREDFFGRIFYEEFLGGILWEELLSRNGQGIDVFLKKDKNLDP